MKIGIHIRENTSKWGGDIVAIDAIKEGLLKFNYEVIVDSDINKLLLCDFIFLTNTTLDQFGNYSILKINNKKYGIINLQEDFIKFSPHLIGSANYIYKMLNEKYEPNNPFHFTLEYLEENPDCVLYFTGRPPTFPLTNIDPIKYATINIANSNFEKNIILRDVPTSNVEVVPLSLGMADRWDNTEDETFLEKYNLKKKNYVLQVGRLEGRKNQLHTLLALKDIEEDLVFIFSSGLKLYEDLLIPLIKKYRKNRTIIISQNEPQVIDNLEMYKFDDGQKLSSSLLKSAFQNAKVNCHPAFQELPGYTYLESLFFNVPTIASEWASISDYLEIGGDINCNGLIHYVKPYDIKSIRETYNKIKNLDIKNTNTIFNRTPYDLGLDMNKLLKNIFLLQK
jgi:glycosyltransferase involved in cell wall biosynthesis